MNVSTIAAMIQADPTITNDVAGYIAAMNLRNVVQTVQQPVVVTQAVTMTTSIAEMNGGRCTVADVQAAVAQLNSAPQYTRLQSVVDAVNAAIASGQVTSLATLKTAFQTAVANLS